LLNSYVFIKNFIKNFYETVKVPETVNVAVLHPPGVVAVELHPGVTVNVLALGPLTITIPEPPCPAAFDGPG
jgi:hypothetical protein